MHRIFTSFRAALVVPFVVIVALVAITISLLSYKTGLDAVDELSEQLMLDISNRVSQATTRQLASSTVMLNALAPTLGAVDANLTPKQLTPQSFASFEERLWVACNLYPDEPAYVYYGANTGEFIGLRRDPQGRYELRERQGAASVRTTYETVAPGMRGAVVRTDSYDPRTRPWYELATQRQALTWSPVYVDYTTKALTVTLAKPINAASLKQHGVVATDIPLTALAEFMRGLQVSRTGVAFIVEENGALIATSTREPLVSDSGSQPTRLRADQSGSALVREAYAQLIGNANTVKSNKSVVRGVEISHYAFDHDVGRVHMSTTAQRNAAGLDWTMVVAIPRTDHMGNVRKTILQNLLIGLVAVGLAITAGLWIMSRVTGDVLRLTDATRRLARGERTERLFSGRKDELAAIATAVEGFKDGLLVDPLTGALTRATFEKRFAAQLAGRGEHFALVFIDLDQFKQVNDRYGHAIGDVVLIEAVRRIAATIRADDVLARYGGDEFVVLMSGLATDAALSSQIDRLCAALDAPMSVEGHAIHSGGSCGGALHPRDGTTLDQLMQVADARMYEQKRGRASTRT